MFVSLSRTKRQNARDAAAPASCSACADSDPGQLDRQRQHRWSRRRQARDPIHCGIPPSLVSRTTRYPARHGVPRFGAPLRHHCPFRPQRHPLRLIVRARSEREGESTELELLVATVSSSSVSACAIATARDAACDVWDATCNIRNAACERAGCHLWQRTPPCRRCAQLAALQTRDGKECRRNFRKEDVAARQSRRRCGRGEPGPSADVAGVSPVPAQMWQG